MTAGHRSGRYQDHRLAITVACASLSDVTCHGRDCDKEGGGGEAAILLGNLSQSERKDQNTIGSREPQPIKMFRLYIPVDSNLV